MRVTEKGQVTIPKNVRRHLGIIPGSEVEFDFVEGGAVIRKVERAEGEIEEDVRALVDHLRRFKGSMNLGGMSPDSFFHMLRD